MDVSICEFSWYISRLSLGDYIQREVLFQTMQVKLSEWPRCNDLVADSHFPQFSGTVIQCELARCFPRSVLKVGQKYQYFEWSSTVNSDGFKVIIFQYIICEPFRSWKEGFAKLHVNLWKIWWKFKCRTSMSYLPYSFELEFLSPVPS